MGENPTQVSLFRAAPLQEVTNIHQPAYKVESYPLRNQTRELDESEKPPMKKGKYENISPAEVADHITQDILN